MMRFLVVLSLWTLPVLAEAAVSSEENVIFIHGPIVAGDVSTFAQSLEQRQGVVLLSIDSPGGDAHAAIAMGRLARSRRTIAAVPAHGRCDSSCVLLLVGASTRYVLGQVGLHRPYLGLEPDLPRPTQAEVERMFETVRAYLMEMHVADRIFELMMSTPPEDMKVLSGPAFHSLVPNEDPVFAEREAAYEARRFRLDTATYRKREAAAYRLCVSNDPAASFDCKEAFMWNLDLSTYKERREIAEALCELTEDDREVAIATGGDARDHPFVMALEDCRYRVFTK